MSLSVRSKQQLIFFEDRHVSRELVSLLLLKQRSCSRFRRDRAVPVAAPLVLPTRSCLAYIIRNPAALREWLLSARVLQSRGLPAARRTGCSKTARSPSASAMWSRSTRSRFQTLRSEPILLASRFIQCQRNASSPSARATLFDPRGLHLVYEPLRAFPQCGLAQPCSEYNM